MTRDELAAAYARLPASCQACVLADFAHTLTVVARGTYVAGTPDVADPRMLRLLNEVLHRVIGHLRHLLADRRARAADDTFVGVVLRAGEQDLAGLFEEALRPYIGRPDVPDSGPSHAG